MLQISGIQGHFGVTKQQNTGTLWCYKAAEYRDTLVLHNSEIQGHFGVAQQRNTGALWCYK